MQTNQLKLDRSTAETAKAGAEGQLKSLKSRFDILEKKCRALESQLSTDDNTKDQEIKKLQDQVEKLVINADDLRSQRDGLRDTNQQLASEGATLKDEVDGLKASVQSSEEKLEDAQSEHSSKQRDAEEEIEKLNEQVAELNASLAVYTNEKLPELRKQIDEFKCQRQTAEANCQTANTKIQDQTRVIEDVNEQLTKTSTRLLGLENDNKTLKQQLDQANDQNGTLTSTNEEMKRQNEASNIQYEVSSLSFVWHCTLASNFLQSAIKQKADEYESIVNQTLGPLLDFNLADQTVRDNILSGWAAMASTTADPTESLQSEDSLKWSLSIVPSDQLHHPIDSNLPQRLWLHSCSSNTVMPLLALAEQLCLAIRQNTAFNQPQAMQMVLIAASNTADRIADSTDQYMHCLATLRILEVAIRFRVGYDKEYLKSVVKKIRTSIPEESHLGLCKCIQNWLVDCLAGEDRPEGPLDIIQRLDLAEISQRVQNDPSTCERTIFAAGRHATVAVWSDQTLAVYDWDELELSAGMGTDGMYSCIGFKSSRSFEQALSGRQRSLIIKQDSSCREFMARYMRAQVLAQADC